MDFNSEKSQHFKKKNNVDVDQRHDELNTMTETLQQLMTSSPEESPDVLILWKNMPIFNLFSFQSVHVSVFKTSVKNVWWQQLKQVSANVSQ